jgi:2-desacetyl-2-hydroxyethyl bacteriochlorophyllide A dehydrogenase
MATPVADRIRPYQKETAPGFMQALVFRGPHNIHLEEVPIPKAGSGEAVIQVTMTTICGTDLHIVRGEYEVKPGLVLGHEAVGRIHELGPGVEGFSVGDRVLVGAITPCGQCHACLGGNLSQCGGALGGWQLGNTINGAQAQYMRVPHAQANLAAVPADLFDDQVILLADVASTGFSAAEAGAVQLGDMVAVFAEGPIGLCATLGAKLRGAGLIIGVEGDRMRARMAREMGASYVLDPKLHDVVAEIQHITDGRGVDVAIEALGTQETFENALRVLRPGGTLASLGVYSGKLAVPVDAFRAGLGDQRIVTSLCPGGKERMRRLLELVDHGAIDLRPLLTHRYPFEQIEEAYKVFGERQNGVIKVALVVSEDTHWEERDEP